MQTIRIEAGDQTEYLVQFVTNNLDDETLDGIELSREVDKPFGLVSEPITTAVILTLGPPAIIAVGRLLERLLEARRQLQTLTIIAQATTDDETRRLLTDLAKAHAQVAVSYSLPEQS